MYLKCLSPPPALLSGAPALHDASWSLDPPGTADYEALRGWLHDKLHDWRRRRENLQFGTNGSQNTISAPTPISANNSPVHNEEALYYEHLSKAHHKWVELSAQAREQQWHHECARAYACEQEEHQATVRLLEHAEQEIQLLRSQVAQMNANILPAEFIQFPPGALPITRKAMSSLPDTNASTYDADAFIAKWKGRIRSARSTQIALPTSPRTSSHQPTNSNGSSRYDLLPKSTREAQGTSQGQEHDREGGLEDAPGEEDEDGYGQQSEGKIRNQHLSHQSEVDQPPLRGSRRLMGPDFGHKGGEGTDVDMESS